MGEAEQAMRGREGEAKAVAVAVAMDYGLWAMGYGCNCISD